MNFKAKIWKAGGSNVFTVPKAFIENGLLESGKEYQIQVEEVAPDEN